MRTTPVTSLCLRGAPAASRALGWPCPPEGAALPQRLRSDLRGRTLAAIVGLACLGALGGIARPSLAATTDDVQEPFFRGIPQPEHRAFVKGPQESVDPFSGTLLLVHTDLVLPGRGGLDLKIIRTYSSKIWGRADYTSVSDGLIAAKERSPLGLGWQMHQGRLRNPWHNGWDPCTLGDTPPVFELPDGTSITFYPTDSTNTNFKSREHWKMYRPVGPAAGVTITVTSNEGIKYEMDGSLPSTNTSQWYYGDPLVDAQLIYPVKRISDPDGNAITITYYSNQTYPTAYRGAISSISDSYGRSITFSWDSGSNTYTSMYANGTYYFNYTTSDGHKLLTSVDPPAGGGWDYSYNTTGNVYSNKYALNHVTYPYGGTISYTYSGISFYTGDASPVFPAVTSRTIGGYDVPSGSWSYSYSSPSSGYSTTTISRPGGSETHTFFGFGAVSSGNIWKVGLPVSMSGPDESVSYSWGSGSSISAAILAAPVYSSSGYCRGRIDTGIYPPRLLSRTVSREGTHTTSYGSHDQYGNPGSISESGPGGSRSHSLSYWTSSSANIVRGRVSSDSISNSFGSYSNSWGYNSSGRKTSETRSGITTTYSYSSGNLTSMTDGAGKTTTYSAYSYGQPTSISYAGVTSMSQNVNWLGLVYDQSGLKEWTYGYDAIGRMTSKAPKGGGGAWSMSRTAATIYTTRSGFYEYTYLDGFGRPTGTSNSGGVSTSITYNARGCVTARDYGYASDSFSVDDLCRVHTVYHSGGGSVSISHGSSTVTVTNERGNATTYTYKYFGDPDERYLVSVGTGVGTTTYDYNGEGSLTSIAGVGGSRSYGYSNNFLTSESNPETGSITYDRNGVGLMTRKTMGGGTTYYAYDGAHRLTSVTYPGSGDDVSMRYDSHNNLTSMSSSNGGSYSYSYDGGNRLTSQTFSYGGQSYTTSYGYNGVDCVTAMTYPTGTSVSLGCNSLGQTTSISGVASSISYHDSGQIDSMSLNGRTVDFGYDGRGRMTSVYSSGAVGLTYTLDGVGNVTGISDTYGSSRSMSYDSVDRLTSASGAWGNASYGYDSHGNRTSKNEGGNSTTYSYSSNRLTSASGYEASSFQYDAAGNMIEGNGFTFTWDGANRLESSSDGATYYYNGHGQRVKRVAGGRTLIYHYDKDGHLIAETRDNGKKVREHFYVLGRLLKTHGKVTGD
jgi:YD repeat-containing protein